MTQENDDSYSSLLRRQIEAPAEPPAETPVEAFARKRRRVLWIAGVVVAAIFILPIFGVLGGFFWFSRSEAAKVAIAAAKSSPALAERLGKPVEAGWLVSGSIGIDKDSGHAELTIPISGPKGSGTIYTEQTKQAGVWHFKVLQFRDAGGSHKLDLLAADSKPQQVAPTP